MEMQYECYNAFPNLKSVPEPFFIEKALDLDEIRIIRAFVTWCYSRALHRAFKHSDMLTCMTCCLNLLFGNRGVTSNSPLNRELEEALHKSRLYD